MSNRIVDTATSCPLTFRYSGGMTDARLGPVPDSSPLVWTRVTILKASDPLPQLQRVGMLETPVLQAFQEGRAENCSEKCSYGIPKVQQGSTDEFCKPLKTQGKARRVFTGDPLVRRRWMQCFASALFSGV